MDKKIIEQFIKKYNLNGIIESVKWISSATDKTLKMSVTSECKTLLASVTMNNWEGFGDAEIGIGDTARLKSTIAPLGESIAVELSVDVSPEASRVTGMNFTDTDTTLIFPTSDLSVVPKWSSIKNVPPFNVEIELNKPFVDKFIKCKNSLSEVQNFTLLMNKNDKLELVLGYNNYNSQRFNMGVTTKNGMDKVAKTIHFNANHLKEILNANPEFENPSLFVSDDGMASVSFKSDAYEMVYRLVAVQVD